MNLNDQDRQWEGMVGWRRGAALAGWSGGAVGARSKPARLCLHWMRGRKSQAGTLSGGQGMREAPTASPPLPAGAAPLRRPGIADLER